MDWKKEKLKSALRMNKEKLVFLFCTGLILFILAMPGGKRTENTNTADPGAFAPYSTGKTTSGFDGQGLNAGFASDFGAASEGVSESGGGVVSDGVLTSGGGAVSGGVSTSGSGTVSGGGSASYEERIEERIKKLLSGVEGVGSVDVMVVLKASEERVFRVDRDTTQEASGDPAGGESSRTTRQELSENTVLTGGSSNPLVEKELMPEISGIVICADGGGSAVVQAEISEAMEALFGLPSHKIKVLKRVKEGV